VSATLLDTHALLWLIDGNPMLGRAALGEIARPGAELFFSYASAWEIAIKFGIGKLELPESPEAFVMKHLKINKIRLLPISLSSIFSAGSLPLHHRDPFDRLIIA